MLLRLLMEAVLSLENTLLLFLMAVPNTSSTPLTITTDMSPRSPMKELLYTQRRNLMHLPPHIMLKSNNSSKMSKLVYLRYEPRL